MEVDTFQRTTPRVPFDAIAAMVQEKAASFFHHLPRELREERVQEVLCIAWEKWEKLKLRPDCNATPLTVCWNTCRMVRAGRRFCGPGQGHWDAETRKSRTNIEGLSEPSRRELFASLARRQDNPAEVARCRIDYADYADRFSDERQRTILASLAAGSLKMEIGKQIGVSGARVGQLVRGMADIYVGMFGLPGFEHRAREQQKRRPGRQPKRLRAAA